MGMCGVAGSSTRPQWISSEQIVRSWRSARAAMRPSSSRSKTRPTGLWGLHSMNRRTPSATAASVAGQSHSQRWPLFTRGVVTRRCSKLAGACRKGGYTGVAVNTPSPGWPTARTATLKPVTTPGSHTSHSGWMRQAWSRAMPSITASSTEGQGSA
jgi:hypothetical protein